LARRTRTFAVPALDPRWGLRQLTKAVLGGGVAVLVASIIPAIAQAAPPTTVAAAQSQIDSLRNQAEIASEQFNATHARLAQAQQASQNAAAVAAKAQAGLTASREKVDTFAANAYRSGGVGQSVLSTVLAGGDAPRTLQKIATLQHLSSQQSAVLRDAVVADLRYQQASRAATQATAAATVIAAGIATQQQHIEALIAQSQQVLNKLSADQRAMLLATQRARSAAQQAKASAALATWRAAHAARPVSRAVVRQALLAPQSAQAAPLSVTGSAIAERAIAAAMSKLGSRYVYGAGGPNTFDCSGLVQWAYGQAGVRTAHYTGAFWAAYRHVSTPQLQPGDLVFFFSDHHHVGVYLGGGMMINAPFTGDVVRIVPVFSAGSGYSGAARIVG
jgi:cell wall-associated NlpC family hydrolase